MENSLTIRQKTAMELHAEIKANGELSAEALVAFCRGLKRMRDENLYTELGCENFEDYAESYFGIGKSQAYAYVSGYEKLGEETLKRTASLGISKIKLLAQLNEQDRGELLESGDAGEMTTKQLQEYVKKAADAEKELAVVRGEVEELAQQNEDWKETAEVLQSELKELKAKPTPVAVQQADPKAIKQQIDEAVEKARKKAVAEQDKAIIEAREQAKKQGIEEGQKTLKAELLIADKAKADALERAAEMEKKLKLSANPEVLKFSFYFEELQGAANKMLGIIDGLKASDPESASKLAGALGAAVKAIGAKI